MKLRIRSNSLRLRLGPREVDRLLRDGFVREQTRFGADATQLLRYQLTLDRDATRMSARIDAVGVVVSIPRLLAQQWAAGGSLSLCEEQDVGGGEKLGLLIEKDLRCRDDLHESDQDVYPNPSDACAL